MKIKVMHLMSTHAFSGAENVACQIIKQFENDSNYDMVYCSEIGSNKQRLEDLNIKTICLEKFGFFEVKKAIDKYKPDIIHSHDIKASVLASLFSNKAAIISHVHANHENMRKFNLKTLIYSLCLNKYSKIIWVSQSAMDNFYYLNKVKEKSIVLYNAIDPFAIKKKVAEDKNIYDFDLVYIGRLNYQKNPERLLNIVEAVAKDKKDLKVAIVGSGDLKDELEKHIKEKKLEKNVKMFGFVDNPYKILSESKIMILTSRYEGTPMCALESMALSVPIVSTPTDGMIELIESGVNGFISDNDAKIVEFIIEYLADENMQNSYKINTAKRFNNICNITKYTDEIKKIYEKGQKNERSN